MDTMYIAIISGCNVEAHQGKNHSHESRHACNRIDLRKGADKARVLGRATKPERTDPYRPTVGSTPSDGTPLVVKSGDELPARSRR